MTIIALDLSKNRTGWACFNKGWNTARFGHWVLGSSFTSQGEVFAKLHERLMEHATVMGKGTIYYEQAILPANLNGATNIRSLSLAAGLAAHVESFAASWGCNAHAINVSNWRKDFLSADLVKDTQAKARALRKAGESKASARGELKSLTMERCRQLGFRPRYDDEADALGILSYAMMFHEHVTPPWLADEVLRPALGGAE